MVTTLDVIEAIERLSGHPLNRDEGVHHGPRRPPHQPGAGVLDGHPRRTGRRGGAATATW